ncbi:hypothetical protein BN12_660004 [Nostocoides japonicum T1-X7]|uniref:Phasin domain-containing protein n=1 Tax=Nostocoides japonicum T1-X7 TaxID=1194083 RepID=A0A077M6Z0_9MICO|nr:hypothetical protein [Tetrasphaera japonica]CCH78679.1 hypothetical protein BN12_320013 [Tetrasphaera japonica T1-X7]CCH79934.1 hypothetical protein BN12_660004 [Tetrasphaera japonica T1-X7]
MSSTDNAAEQYTELFEQGQKAFLDAVDNWSRAARYTFDRFGTSSGTPLVAPEVILDQVFDFAVKILEVQRDVSRRLLAAATEASDATAAVAKASAER